MIDIIYNDLKSSGTFETNLVLYDHLKKSSWGKGEYTIEIADSGTLEKYGIVSNFEITSSGNTITDFQHGMLLTSDESESELLNFVEEIEIEKYYPKEIKVFGIIEDYISGMPVNISIVNQHGNIHEFSVYAKKSGQYDTPVFVNSEWLPGKYNIYVNYRDKIQNSISFTIEDSDKSYFKSESIEEQEQIIKENEIKKFDIIQTDSVSSHTIGFNSSTKPHEIGYNQIDILLEKPIILIQMYLYPLLTWHNHFYTIQ